MAEFKFRLNAIKWPDNETEESCKKNDSIIAHFWIRDRGKVSGPMKIKYSQIGKMIDWPEDIGSSSDWKVDILIPGLKMSVNLGGRFG